MSRFLISIILVFFGLSTGFDAQVSAQSPASAVSSLNLVVVSGQNGANVLKPMSAVPPVIQVRDSMNRPVIGAVVTFSAPVDEPTVKFPNGQRTYSVVSDMYARAEVESMIPAGVGSFRIEINATYADSSGSTVIAQANYPTLKAATASGTLTTGNRIAEPENQGLSKSAKIAIVAGAVAVAAGLGIYFGTRGHGSSSSSISVGTPVVGAPH